MTVPLAANVAVPVARRFEVSLPILISSLGLHQARQEEPSTYRFIRDTWLELQKSEGVELLDLLIVVRSLPYIVEGNTAYTLADRAMIPATRILELGSECTAVLEAILIAARVIADGAQTAMIVVSDDFEGFVDAKTIQQKPDSAEWKSATSIVAMGRHAQHRFRATTLSSIVEPQFHDVVTVASLSEGGALRFRSCPDFHEVDLRNERLTITAALSTAAAESALVMTNRSANRVQAGRVALSDLYNRFYYSRQQIGHTGGSDIVWNLRSMMFDLDADKTKHIALCGNGIGYAWKVLALERA